MPPSEDDWTPRPGLPLPPPEAAAALASFERRFRVHTQGRDPRVPTWVTFDPADSRRAGPEVLTLLPDQAPVLLLFAGSGSELRLTTLGQARSHLEALQPWEDDDLYLVDPALGWCIALTHPQLGGERLLIVAGALPASDL